MRVLVVYCHPNPASLTAAARERVLAGLERAGHETRLCDLYAEGFRPELSDAEHRRNPGAVVSPELSTYVDDLTWAEALVLVYPTWWSGQPAMLKGWVDRVWACGVAGSPPSGSGRVAPLLTDLRRLVVVTTHGSSKLVNALEGESGKRTVFRSLRSVCSRRVRTRWIALYRLDTIAPERRTAWLDRVERAMTRL